MPAGLLARLDLIGRITRLASAARPWVISLAVHGSALAGLSLLATTVAGPPPAIVTIDTRIDDPASSDAFTEVLADIKAPIEAVSMYATSATASASGGGGGGGGGSGGGIGGLTGGGGGGGFGGSGVVADPGRMSSVKVPSYLVGLGGGAMPGKLSMDRPMGLGSGGFKGEVDAHAADTGAAMDRITREILRMLQTKKVLVIWLFDESLSMKDDQIEVKERFDRVYEELGITRPDAGDAVETVVCSFGKSTHFETGDKPTHDLAKIKAAIEKIPVEESGIENTHQAVEDVMAKYAKYFNQLSRWIALCLVTDESSDDPGKIEETLKVAQRSKTPIYVLGRQAMFGKREVIMTWVDQETGEVFHPTLDRGPESADLELLQFDGLHGRWDNQASGFGPYELSRLARDSGGIYFILPGEEELGIGKAALYDYLDLKQYVPEYISRREYLQKRDASEFRRTIYHVIDETRAEKIAVPGSIAVGDPPSIVKQAQAADERALRSLLVLDRMNETLIKLRPQRERESNRRWQADYDLIAGQIPAYEVMMTEYHLMMQEIIKNPLKPVPTNDRTHPPTGWSTGHGSTRRIDDSKNKKLVEQIKSKEENARALLAKVIEEHPKTPWADRAAWELARPWGATYTQHNLHIGRAGAAQRVPKF